MTGCGLLGQRLVDCGACRVLLDVAVRDTPVEHAAYSCSCVSCCDRFRDPVRFQTGQNVSGSDPVKTSCPYWCCMDLQGSVPHVGCFGRNPALLQREKLGGCFPERRDLCSLLFSGGVAAVGDQRPVVQRLLAGRGERHGRVGPESDVSPFAVDGDALHPAACACMFHIQYESGAVAMLAGTCCFYFGCGQFVHGFLFSCSHVRSHKKRGNERYLCPRGLLRACLVLLGLLRV